MPNLRHPRPRATAWDTSLPGIHAVAVLALLDPPMPADRPGSCAGYDPEMWFPDTRRPGPVAEAKAICAGCPVRAECLHAGLGEEFGIWGGLTPSERGAMLRAA